MTQNGFAEAVRELGGQAYIVGGFVRDSFRGVIPHDTDYVITGISTMNFERRFPAARRVGKSFPVYILKIGGESAEVAFARRERKTGRGYLGFAAETSPDITIEEDLSRRDTTINAMAFELSGTALIDPFGGRRDIERGMIRAVSGHFLDDPVRALRAARQAAEFGYGIETGTVELMRSCADELIGEPWERKWEELMKALSADRPSVFFRALLEAGLLSSTFPEIAALVGKTQPQMYHPEGDAFEHSVRVLDMVASVNRGIMTRFCALVHDIGKGGTPEEMLPHHYGHEKRGAEILDRWNEARTLPKKWLESAKLVSLHHMRAATIKKRGKMAELLLSVHSSPLSVKDFRDIVAADSGGRELPAFLRYGEECLEAMLSARGGEAPAGLSGRAVGEWLRGERIRRFSRRLTEILKREHE